ncbi:MAG TPA: hypothetical protein VHT70_02570 [Candidatus Saccharimonadales bacterium]|jgi:hypothetical protein|nr:hypothetical protein [Candidatus Saccharimonadales bacterium]
MKKKLCAFLIALGLLMPVAVTSGSALAATAFGACDGNAGSTDVCKDVKSQASSNTNPLIDTLKIAINIFSIVIGVTAVIVLVISGFRMVVSLGDPSGFQRGRDGVVYACIGLAVTAMAQLIVAFVLNKL